MNIFEKLFGREENQKLMDKSPCLAPWYFAKDKPRLIKDEKVLVWKPIGSRGITAFTDEEENCYALLNMVCYVLASNDNKSFLVWDRDLEKAIGLQTIKIFYYEVSKLQSIVGRDKIISLMRKEERKMQFATKPTAAIEFAFNPREEAMKFVFPEEFKKFGEFILITELQNLYDNCDPDVYWHNTTMLYIKPDSGWVFNYPQDWFNKSNSDFGYQWITRAIKNPKTSLIHGQGIRLSDFILDNTYRQRLNKE